jgi:hypothetical protein
MPYLTPNRIGGEHCASEKEESRQEKEVIARR